jgi:hypothetical protein
MFFVLPTYAKIIHLALSLLLLLVSFHLLLPKVPELSIEQTTRFSKLKKINSFSKFNKLVNLKKPNIDFFKTLGG